MKLPFDNPPVTTVLILLVLGFLAWAVSTVARSEPRLDAEIGATTVRGPASALVLNLVWPEAGPGDADFQCGLGLISRYHLRQIQQPNQAVAYCALVDGIGRFDVGIGPAYLQNTDLINGSHFNFTLLMRYRFAKKWALTVRHFSNAGTVKPNLGRDVLLLTRDFS